MTILEGIAQGVIQGLTEFLPVSSSGHLSLFQHFFGLSGSGSLFFTLMLHVGTLVAVCAAFWKTIAKMIAAFFIMLGDIFKGRFHFSTCPPEQRMVVLLIIALLPLLGFYFLKDYAEMFAEDSDIIVEGVCFLFTGTLLLLADRTPVKREGVMQMKPLHALVVGLFQGVALLPGVSRSGSTTASGMLMGFNREYMVEFSFILGIPVILASSATELRSAVATGLDVPVVPLVAGVITAAIVGYLAIVLVRWLARTDRYAVFGYYTLVLGLVVVAIGIIEHSVGLNFVDYIKQLVG